MSSVLGTRDKVKFEGAYDSVTVIIYQEAAPYIDSEIDLGAIDGFDDPENGIVVLQQATKGTGTDIVIMGDGFVEKHFLPGGRYETLMKREPLLFDKVGHLLNVEVN